MKKVWKLLSSFATWIFHGTFFATVIGPTLIKNNIKVEFYSKVYFFSFLFFCHYYSFLFLEIIFLDLKSLWKNYIFIMH